MFFKLPFCVSFSVYLLQSNTRYFVNHLERFAYHYIYIYILYIYIYIIQQFSLRYVAFESMLLNFTQNLYEIGPSNAYIYIYIYSEAILINYMPTLNQRSC